MVAFWGSGLIVTKACILTIVTIIFSIITTISIASITILRDSSKPQSSDLTLEAQLPIYWVPVLKSLYTLILSVAQGPTIWVPGLLGLCWSKDLAG